MTTFRDFVNRTGVTYNAARLDTMFAEDINQTNDAVNALENDYTMTVEFMSGVLTTTIYNPYALKIVSVTNIKNAPTTTITVNGSAYTLNTNIAIGSTIVITVSTASVIRLNNVKT